MDEQTHPINPNPTAESSRAPGDSSLNQFLHEAGRFALTLARAAGKAAEDLTGLMVIQVNGELRARMDDWVEAGLAENRARAALALLQEGVRANRSVYEQVEKTRARIQALRGQLRDLIGQQS